MAQIISCFAVIVFARCTHAYEKRPGLTVVAGITSAIVLSIIFVPEKPKKLSEIEEGKKFLKDHIPNKIFKTVDLYTINWCLGKIIWVYCFGECKDVELPRFLSKSTCELITNWRSRKLDPKDFKAHLDKFESIFEIDDDDAFSIAYDVYNDSGNALFTEIKGMSHFENKASSVFMQAWAAIRESDNV